MGLVRGIVTIEDIVEEIVGEIRDGFDEKDPRIEELEDGSYSVDRRISIGTVNEAVGSDFESEDFETIGGFVLGHLGRPPRLATRSEKTATSFGWRPWTDLASLR